ncbi:MAG: ABC transporter permease [Christensenellales bacterium]|jgi:ABC-2 type transport system permease protein
MRTLRFLKKEALHLITAPETLLLMILFPVALTWVLGTALSSATGHTFDLPEVNMPIVSEGGMLSDIYIANSREAGITFEKTEQAEVDERIAAGTLKGYVELKDKELTLHSDDQGSIESMLVKMYSTAFIKQANLSALAIKEGKFAKAAPQFKNFASVEGIDGANEPDSFGYYGVTMLTMIIMYGSIQAMSLLALEKNARTAQRLKVSPYPMNRVFFVKTATACGIILMQALIVILVNRFAYGIEYRNIGMVLAMLIPLAVFVTSLGVASYQVLRNDNAASAFLNLITVAFVFMGQGYTALPSDNGLLDTLYRISPIGWINKGLFTYIYQGETGAILSAGLRLLGLGLIMLLIAYVLFRREEGSDLVAAN